MQSGVRRFAPALVFVLVGGIAVWVASPESLTGSADGAGCAGAPPLEVQTEALTDEDPEAARLVAGLINLPEESFRRNTQDLVKTREQIVTLGGAAFPSLLSAMQSEGIDSPAGAEITRLAAGAMAEQTYDPQVLEAAVSIAVNNIVQAGADAVVPVELPGFVDLVDQSASGLNPQQLEDGFHDLLEAPEGAELLNLQDLSEAIANSLNIARWAHATLSQEVAEQLDSTIMDQVTALDPKASVAVPLLIDLDRTAPPTVDWGDRFLVITQSVDRLGAARAVACEAARARKVDMSPLFGQPVRDFDAGTVRCILRAAEAAGHVDFATLSTKHPTATARVAGWHTLGAIGTAEHLDDALDIVLNREGETDYEPGIPERVAALEAVIGIATRYPSEQSGLLGNLPAASELDPLTASLIERLQGGFGTPEGVE
jgi:hypothetical protein